MKRKIGDKIVFIGGSDYAWALNYGETYTICGISSRMPNEEEFYYAVTWKNGTETTWYKEQDFLTIQECRKLKLKKLHSIEDL